MKKLVIFICVMIFCSSCRLFNEWRDGKLSVDWRVMNVTEQTLIFKYPYSSSILTDDFEFMEFIEKTLSAVLREKAQAHCKGGACILTRTSYEAPKC